MFPSRSVLLFRPRWGLVPGVLLVRSHGYMAPLWLAEGWHGTRTHTYTQDAQTHVATHRVVSRLAVALICKDLLPRAPVPQQHSMGGNKRLSSASVAPAEDEELVMCQLCREEKPISCCTKSSTEDPTTGAVDAFRCRCCNAVKTRAAYIVKTRGIAGYTELAGESRNRFYLGAAELFGDKLQKHICESITKVRLDKHIMQFASSGDAMSFDDAEKKWSDRPTEWANVLENAHQFVCPVRKIQMIVPEPKLKTGASLTDA